MNEHPPNPVFSTPASLWNGTNQLLGNLELWETAVIFRLADFQESHLNLTIPLANIEKVEAYLVFNLAKNGLRIQDKEGRYDLFVLDDVRGFKKVLLERLDLI
ncbi:MAG: hypothetical protein DHS20C18_25490 [Saprospiraceae bacterium]|nr:MAG: hypothetical protein DHS20C18_25490 [Saprospiraceae bacterium]